MTIKALFCSQCGIEEVAGTFEGMPVCEACGEGLTELAAERSGPDPHGDRDPSPEELAGWAMDDKLAMYRNEY